MEDGVKGSSVSPPESKVALKAGWLKKSTGLLGLWKDRYIQILKSQLLICDSEDDQKCLETLELDNYERCQDHKAFLKRKRQFTLIPSPGTKVQEVKFQAKNAEERDEWIQTLNDGINRGKNKILDEVKVDTSISLDHVTRDRAKVGAAKRRPPTRIHLKEVAEAADDDSLRLGLDALDTGALTVVTPMPKPKDAVPPSQKEPIKIPMPPTKPNEPQMSETTISNTTDNEDKGPSIPMPPQKEAIKIPMPPTKPNQPQTSETSIPDTTDSKDEAPSAPSPPPKSLKELVHTREKLLSQNEQSKIEDSDSAPKVCNSESKENLCNVVNSPPQPPPKILSDKTKIKWVGTNSDSEEKEDFMLDERGSKENLVEFESDEMENPSSTPETVLTEGLKASELNSVNNLEKESKRLSKHLEFKTKNKDLQEISTESNSIENKEKDQQEVNSVLIRDAQNEDTEQPAAHKSDEKKLPCLKYRKKSKHMKTTKHQIEYQAKASSMGDLLSPTSIDYPNEKDDDFNMSHLTKDHLHQVEMKLARGKEKTKDLLNQVLMGQLGNATEGNGKEGNPETILNELMTQLQEASEVLQVIKEKGQRNNLNMSEVVTERQKQKELLTIQRRSVPF